ncbi:MAG: SDR family NAD(P)-dependent oxidoreductase [Paludibacteraceae bacterium]|nr:SDR family NAD(P)-dependent oxidoreductase [Paludibacteraceae bacterium]
MYALITGASSGVGKAYATVLARDYGHDVLLVSNQENELQELAARLTQQYGVKALPYYSNLAREEAAEELYRWCGDNHVEVDILINNAGMFFWQPLIEAAAGKAQTMLMLHMVTPAMLCRLFGEDMCRRKKGWILNMSSMTAWMPFPGIQCYNATKAFVLSFSKSIWYEMKPYGVGVTTLTPGAIDTPLYGLNDKARRQLVRFGISFPPERFAQIALRRMFKKRKQAMPGWVNHIAVPLLKHLPDWAVFTAMKIAPQYKNIPLRRRRQDKALLLAAVLLLLL